MRLASGGVYSEWRLSSAFSAKKSAAPCGDLGGGGFIGQHQTPLECYALEQSERLDKLIEGLSLHAWIIKTATCADVVAKVL